VDSEQRLDPAEDLSRLYRETIMRHAREPVGYRQAIGCTHRHEEHNPQCGDRVVMKFRIVEEQIEAAAFEGEACAICMASASMLCEELAGGSVGKLVEMHGELLLALGAEGPGAESESPRPAATAQLSALLGVRKYPSRIRCATLPWTAALRALSGGRPAT
jgi:nitrogen fixation NifU-like protein